MYHNCGILVLLLEFSAACWTQKLSPKTMNVVLVLVVTRFSKIPEKALSVRNWP